jgi:hypothetical protein
MRAPCRCWDEVDARRAGRFSQELNPSAIAVRGNRVVIKLAAIEARVLGGPRGGLRDDTLELSTEVRRLRRVIERGASEPIEPVELDAHTLAGRDGGRAGAGARQQPGPVRALAYAPAMARATAGVTRNPAQSSVPPSRKQGAPRRYGRLRSQATKSLSE